MPSVELVSMVTEKYHDNVRLWMAAACLPSRHALDLDSRGTPSIGLSLDSRSTPSSAISTSGRDAAGGVISILFSFIVSVIVELGVATLRLERLKEVWNGLISLEEDVDKFGGEVFVALVVERGGTTNVADTTSTTNAVDVLVDATVLG